jgi:8-oxo-dGTP pyrophosphatase MutT (NUDIX family)
MSNETNPWQILSTNEVYDNQWINVKHHDVLNPAGGNGIYGVVHFKNFAIGIVALDDEKNVYLVRQFRFALNEYSLEIPAGGGPFSQSPLESAKRELLEEAGIIAQNWQRIVTAHLSNSVTDEYGEIFLATDLTHTDAEPEDTEDIIIKKLPFDEAYQMIEDGTITDSPTILGLQKVKIMMLQGLL